MVLSKLAVPLTMAGLCYCAALLVKEAGFVHSTYTTATSGCATHLEFDSEPWSVGHLGGLTASCSTRSMDAILQDQASLLKRSEAGIESTRTNPRAGGPDTSIDARPTPQPTGKPTTSTTVHIANTHDFALLLPHTRGELISDAESDGTAFCTSTSSDPSCADRLRLPEGFVRAAAVTGAEDGSWIQITGCIDPAKAGLVVSDEGGQFDVRFPNGAQCTFGGYGASFIEQVEPASSRFCLRCCAKPNDQTHCNSHKDRDGCPIAIPGQYDFPELGVSCS